ncbi:MAG: RagB/SusD family nutrient uptake outer membrane protein [Bacteroidales bacterium]|nr:RagB/SusD family nutrient uptake outer membrane protein [Bacteroidales bacterium]
MKKLIQLLTIALVSASLFACESLKLGDAGLSRAPETSGATVDTLFASIKDADKVLASAYYYLHYGLVTDFDNLMSKDVVEAITDHYSSARFSEGNGPNELYYSGALTPSANNTSSQAYCFGKEKDYHVIRYAWLFLENADRIPDADPAELAQKKAEAKLCMAIAYANMVRYIGGVPILDHAVVPSENMYYPRNTFAETIQFIVDLCDQAAPDLPWSVSKNDDGRLTRAAALGLKLRMLCYAASPTFNSDTPWHPQADEYTCYMNYDANRWKAAKDAADEFMAQLLANGYYAMEQASPDANGEITPRAYRLAYRAGYFNRGSTECIISIRKSNSTSYHSLVLNNPHEYGSGCTLEWVNKFGWADGTPFPKDYDWTNQQPQLPFFRPDPTETIKIPGIETRDPRLYENVAVPGDIWRDGTVGNVYSNHRHFQANMPGFGQMKYILQDPKDRAVPVHWCMMRLPEVLLNAAEAYNEYDGGPSEKAYTWVDAVRARVGLCPLEDLYPEGMTQAQFREALLNERDCEFGFEEVRWFDIVRYGLDSALNTKLHGLKSVGNKDNQATSFTYEVIDLRPVRSWWTNWDRKWFMQPIPSVEINKNYGMTQNPGW